MNHFEQIITTQRGDMKLAYVYNDEVNYLALFDRFLADAANHHSIGIENPKKLTYLMRDQNKKYIFKIDGFVEYRPERQFITKITGDFFFNLLHRLAKITLDKCDVTYELYLVAFNQKTKQHYMIFNFIEGTSLTNAEMHTYSAQIKNCIETLHRYNVVSHDVHGGNFLLTPENKIKVIDLTNSGFIWLTKANDAVQLWDRFQIKIDVPFLAMACKKLERGIHRASRKLRGKPIEQ